MFLATASGFSASFKIFVGQAYELIAGLGGPGLFLIALGDSSFLSLPEGNDLLIVVLSTGQTWGWMTYYVLMTLSDPFVGVVSFTQSGGEGESFWRNASKGKG